MIKDIAVHLTGSAEDAIRIAQAAHLARSLDARITGIHLHELPEILEITDPSGSTFLRELLEQSEQRAASVGKALRRDLDRLGVACELQRLEAYPQQAGRLLARQVRQSDIFVGTRPYGAPRGGEWIEEAVLFESGRPCLFVPPGHRSEAGYRNILVAWKSSGEAARAVADALPLLRQAASVVIGIVDEPGAAEAGRAPGEDIMRYLQRHGVAAAVHVIEGWGNVGGAILEAAATTAADLIVMGAYGHSRYREWILGGATRDVLSTAAVPILVAH